MKNSDEPRIVKPRSICRPSRLVCIAKSGEPGIIAGVMISANTRKRIQVISIEGKVADRYFAVTSEAPRKIVEASTSAMPLNGRSARAGALRTAADFFSGKGIGALSSLAAAAGGGVTAISKAVMIDSGEVVKNTRSRDATRSENRMRICAEGAIATLC